MLYTIILLGVCSVFAFPFIWLLLSCFKNNSEIFRPLQILPSAYSFQYFSELWNNPHISFFKHFFNSCFISIAQTIGVILIAVPAGYIFAKHSFKYSTPLFIFCLLSILLPSQILLIPLFEWMTWLKLIDTPASVILPNIANGLALIFFTVAFKKTPNELLDAARSEGANEYRVFLTILPMNKSFILTYALLHFILSWHQHLIPMIMLQSEENMTVAVSLSMMLSRSLQFNYATVMVGSLFILLPTLTLFILLYKNFKSSLADLFSD